MDFEPLVVDTRVDAINLGNWLQPPFNRTAFVALPASIAVDEIACEQGSEDTLETVPTDLSSFVAPTADGLGRSLSQFLESTDSDGFIVLKFGRVAYEWYAPGRSASDRHMAFSATKSLVGSLTGILVAKGMLNPAAMVTAYVPEALGSGFEGASVRHVLDMAVSLDFEEAYLTPDSPFARYRVATGWHPPARGDAAPAMHEFLCQVGRLPTPHGQSFNYLSPVSDMLGWICERAGGAPLAHLISELLWKPLGATSSASITLDRRGAPRAAGGVSATVRDLARFGECMRLGGALNEHQVVPADWVEDIVTGGDRAAWNRGPLANWLPGGCYRSQWWITNDELGAYFAAGIYGQWIYIAPMSGVVVVKVASPPVGPADESLFRLQIETFSKLAKAVE